MQDNGGLRRGGREEREEIPSPPNDNVTTFLRRKQEFFYPIEKNFLWGEIPFHRPSGTAKDHGFVICVFSARHRASAIGLAQQCALGDDGIDFLTFGGDPAILVALFVIFAQLMRATKCESRSNR
jgi:hypothetical protein